MDLFGNEIETIFFEVYKEADLNIRQKMYNMRKTWQSFFSDSTLSALDSRIKDLDPDWPVTSTLDSLESENRFLEEKLAASKMAQLHQKLQEATPHLENEPDSKKMKFDWMETKVNKNNDAALVDDDDEVIEVVVKPIIIEIDDDSDEETTQSTVSTNDSTISRDVTTPTVVTSSINVLDSDGHWINNSTIDVKKLFENSVKIKMEPKDEDDFFEDIGEIFYNGELQIFKQFLNFLEFKNRFLILYCHFMLAPINSQEESNDRRERTTSSRRNEPQTITSIDGNVHFTEPVSVKISHNIKFNFKNKDVCIITAAERAERNRIDCLNRKKIIPKIVRAKADETSALCSIM